VDVWRPGGRATDGRVAIEEPLEIRIDGHPAVVTMRTPGDDRELATGFVLTEGLAGSAADIQSVEPVADVPPASRGNVVDVRLRGSWGADAARAAVARRPGLITSACGVCGGGTIEAVRRRAAPLPAGPILTATALATLPAVLRATQVTFDETGGLHAAGLFDPSGILMVAREDVGRHNAVDKVIGYAALGGLFPLSGHVLLVSGRAGFEIVQKAWVAGIPILASVSAPSSLAVQLAEEAGMTLVGFVRGHDFTVYGGSQRLLT
jgi:FdhD protein